MTHHDRPGFLQVMCALGEAFDTQISDSRLEIYFQALSDLTLDQVREAARAHVQLSKFFPKPVELREAVSGRIEDRADEAWAQLVTLVRRVGYTGKPQWPDPVLERTAKELYGGWQALCARLPSEGPEMLGQAKLFKATYAAYARRASVDRLLPPSKDDARKALSNLKRDLDARSLPAPGLGD
jgi:hypothetical protein